MTRPWLVGRRFGAWTIVSPVVTKNRWSNLLMEAACDCGTKRLVLYENLVQKKSTQCKSCAAKKREARKRETAEVLSLVGGI